MDKAWSNKLLQQKYGNNDLNPIIYRENGIPPSVYTQVVFGTEDTVN